MRKWILCGLILGFGGFAQIATAKVTIKMYGLTGAEQGDLIGTVTAVNTPFGLKLTPKLKDLPPGKHGFHVHLEHSCADHGMAAGGHLDPAHTNKHLGPYNAKGHLGDLPVLAVNKKGMADTPIVAPRLTEKEILGHSLMIHADGDNYSDKPKPLGGGGARIACGVIPD